MEIRIKRFGFVMGVCALAALHQGYSAVNTVILQPTTTAGNHYNSFISSDGLSTGTINIIGQVSRVNGGADRGYLIKFSELSSYLNHPIVSATLRVKLCRTTTTSGSPVTPPRLRAYRMNQSWVNGATWTSRGGGLGNWTTPGGDYDPTPVAICRPVSPQGNNTYLDFDLTALVSDWTADATSHPNNGVLLKWSGEDDYVREWFIYGPNGQAYYAGGGEAPQLILKEAPSHTVNVQTLGAVGDGIHDDTEAFQLAAAELEAADGGTLVIPPGNYKVGAQTAKAPGASGPYWVARSVLSISHVDGLLIKGSPGARIFFDEQTRYGAFSPTDGSHHTTDTTDSSYCADPGSPILIQDSSYVVIRDLEIDGNNLNLQRNTHYKGVLATHGINSTKNINFTIVHVASHDHGGDGVYVKYQGLVDSPGLIKYPHLLYDVVSEYNARQGLSWVGGNGLTAIGCSFNHTGQRTVFEEGETRQIALMPMAGVDIEATNSICRDGLFVGCEFINNRKYGMVALTGDSKYAEFDSCLFWGTIWYSLQAARPGLTFRDCTMYGAVFTSYGDSVNLDLAASYARCWFEDAVGLTYPSYVYTSLVSDNTTGHNVSYDSCVFIANNTKAIGFGQTAVPKVIKNCTITHKFSTTNHNNQSSLRGVTISNTQFQEALSDTNDYYIFVDAASVHVDAGVTVAGPRCRWGSWQPGVGLTGTIPPTP